MDQRAGVEESKGGNGAVKVIEAVENVGAVEIGKFYLVDTIRDEYGAIVPLHGPLHDDTEIIEFPFDHWHIDWRFVNSRMYAGYFDLGGGFMMPWAWPLNQARSRGEVTKRRMKCKRQFGPYVPVGKIPWLAKLEAEYQDAKMKNLICPHRGLRCNATPVECGVVVCRGHGLAFNVKTGALVPRSAITAAEV